MLRFLDKELKKFIVIFFNFLFFSLEKKIYDDTPLSSDIPTIPFSFSLKKYLKSYQGWHKIYKKLKAYFRDVTEAVIEMFRNV